MPRAPGHKLCSTNTGRASALQTCVVDSCSNCSDVIVLAASVAAEHLDSLYGAVSSWYTTGTSPDTLYGLCSCLYTSKHSPGRRVYHKTCLAVPSCWYVPWYACGIPQSPIRHTKPPPEFVVLAGGIHKFYLLDDPKDMGPCGPWIVKPPSSACTACEDQRGPHCDAKAGRKEDLLIPGSQQG